MVPPPVEEAAGDDVPNAGVDVVEEPVQVEGTSQTLLDYHPSLFYVYIRDKTRRQFVEHALTLLITPPRQICFSSNQPPCLYTSHQSDHSRQSLKTIPDSFGHANILKIVYNQLMWLLLR